MTMRVYQAPNGLMIIGTPGTLVEAAARELSPRYAEITARLDKLDDELAEAWLTGELTGQEG